MATSDDQTVPIPEPQGLPLLGNIGAIDNEFPLGSLLSMASKYGKFPGGVFFFFFFFSHERCRVEGAVTGMIQRDDRETSLYITLASLDE